MSTQGQDDRADAALQRSRFPDKAPPKAGPTVRSTLQEIDQVAYEGAVPIYAAITNAGSGEIGRLTVPLRDLTDRDLDEVAGIEVLIVYQDLASLRRRMDPK